MTPPRKKHDAVYGFTLIDPGGNWIRIAAEVGRARSLEAAVGRGDSHGEPGQAAATLDRALERYPDAPAPDRFAALVYRAELAVALVSGSLDAAAGGKEELRGITARDLQAENA